MIGIKSGLKKTSGMDNTVGPPTDLWESASATLNISGLGFSIYTTEAPPMGAANESGPDCTEGVEMELILIPPNIFENISCPFELHVFTPWELGLKISFYSLAILMAVLGNACVLFAIIFNKRMHTRTYFYIANLALSDLMIGVFNMWIHLGKNITNDWPFSPLLCKLFPFFQTIALTASTGCLTVIAGERFFATVYPMKAKFSRAYRHAIVVGMVWIVAIAVAVPMLLVRRMSLLIWADRRQTWCEEVWPRYAAGPSPSEEFVCLYDHPQRRAYYTVQVVVMYFVPVAVTSVAYSVIGFTLRKRKAPGHQTDQILEQQQKTKRKVMRMLFVVFAVFVVCWTPQEVIVLLDAHQPERSNEKIPDTVRLVAIFIALFNSSLNPILYAGLNENCRRGFKELFKCRICRGKKVAPGAACKVRSSRPGATCSPNSTAQGHKKTVSILRQALPRLPPIREDQFETWSIQRFNGECDNVFDIPQPDSPGGDCDKSTDTQFDILKFEEQFTQPRRCSLVRQISNESNVTMDGTGTTMTTSVGSGPEEQ